MRKFFVVRVMAAVIVAGLLASCGKAMDCLEPQCVKDDVFQTDLPRVTNVKMEVGPYGWGAYSKKWPPENIPTDTHTVAFEKGYIEVRENGLLFEPDQLDAILKRIDAMKNPKRPVFVFTYTHGWHHNAFTSDKITTEKKALEYNAMKFDYFMARFAEHVRRLYELNGDDNAPQMLGIYVGWRGKSTTDPVANALNVGNRGAAADVIAARRGENSLREAFQKISDRVAATGRSSRMIATGHSLGGRMMSRMFLPEITNENLHPLGRHTLVAAIEPAISADCYEKFFIGAPVGRPGRLPSFIAITSTDDFAVVGGFSYGHLAPHLDPPGCNDNNRAAREAAIGGYEPYVTHHWNFTRTYAGDIQLPKAGDCGTPKLERDSRWLFKLGDSKWQYPYFDAASPCPTMGGKYHRDAWEYGLHIEKKPAYEHAGAVWNIQTNRNLIDNASDTAKDNILNIGDRHNGFSSTGLADMLGRIAYAQIRWQDEGAPASVPEPGPKKP